MRRTASLLHLHVLDHRAPRSQTPRRRRGSGLTALRDLNPPSAHYTGTPTGRAPGGRRARAQSSYRLRVFRAALGVLIPFGVPSFQRVELEIRAWPEGATTTSLADSSRPTPCASLPGSPERGPSLLAGLFLNEGRTRFWSGLAASSPDPADEAPARDGAGVHDWPQTTERFEGLLAAPFPRDPASPLALLPPPARSGALAGPPGRRPRKVAPSGSHA